MAIETKFQTQHVTNLSINQYKNTPQQEYIIREEDRTVKMCSERNVILHVIRRDVILRVLRATSEELGAVAITYHQESFRVILILFPLFRTRVIACHI